MEMRLVAATHLSQTLSLQEKKLKKGKIVLYEDERSNEELNAVESACCLYMELAR